MPLPPYIASRRAGGRPGPQRLSDHVRAGGGRRGRADRGPAFHRRPDAGARRARHLRAFRDAPCRARHLPAGAERTTPKATRCMPSTASSAPRRAAALNAVKARGGKIVAVGTTSLRLLESAADEYGTLEAVRRRDRHLHHAGLSLPLRRSPVDQLPSAALNPVHAGRRLLGSRYHEARLRPCRRRSAIASIPMAMPACSSPGAESDAMSEPFAFTRQGAGRARAHRRHRHAARA